MAAAKTKKFVGEKFSAEVKKNSRGLHCVIVKGEGIKSPIPGVKEALRFYGCRKDEAASIEVAKKLSEAKTLPKKLK